MFVKKLTEFYQISFKKKNALPHRFQSIAYVPKLSVKFLGVVTALAV